MPIRSLLMTCTIQQAPANSVPVLDEVIFDEETNTMILRFADSETPGTPVYIKGRIDDVIDDYPADGAAIAAGVGADATFSATSTVGAASVSIDIDNGIQGLKMASVTASYDNETWADDYVQAVVDFDTIPPVVESIAIDFDGLNLTLSMSENAPGTGVIGNWNLKVGGSPATLSGITVDGSDVISIQLAAAITYGQTVTLSYTPGDIVDEAGNPLAGFTDVPVTNYAGRARVHISKPAIFWGGANTYLNLPRPAIAGEIIGAVFLLPNLTRVSADDNDLTQVGFGNFMVWHKVAVGGETQIRLESSNNVNLFHQTYIVTGGDISTVQVTADTAESGALPLSYKRIPSGLVHGVSLGVEYGSVGTNAWNIAPLIADNPAIASWAIEDEEGASTQIIQEAGTNRPTYFVVVGYSALTS